MVWVALGTTDLGVPNPLTNRPDYQPTWTGGPEARSDRAHRPASALDGHGTFKRNEALDCAGLIGGPHGFIQRFTSSLTCLW